MESAFNGLDMITYYGICPYDKREDQKTWLIIMSNPEISGMPPAQCAVKVLSDAQHYGTVRERVLDDLENALLQCFGDKKWYTCKRLLQMEAQTTKKPSLILQETSTYLGVDLLYIWHCLQSQKPVMKWKKKTDISFSGRQLTDHEQHQKNIIHVACDILQMLIKGKSPKLSLRMKRHAHKTYDELDITQKRERIAEAIFYNAAQTANLPSDEAQASIYDPNNIVAMKVHWQPVQGLIIFDSGKIRKLKAKPLPTSTKRVKKSKDYLPILYKMVYDLLLHGTQTMSVEMLTNIIIDNYGMPDKHLKEVREECFKTITKVRKLLMEA